MREFECWSIRVSVGHFSMWRCYLILTQYNWLQVLLSGATAGGGAECPRDTPHRKISADLPGKERQGKKGKWRRKEGKRRKIEKGKVEKKIENGRRKSYKWEWRGLFFPHFKALKFVLGLPKMGIFCREKSGKMTLTALKNIPSLTPLALL